uniref:Uncharacterized protein n=1 Tax=Knipowitschia caucasica TaxID=637954 RepID=A0AAV2K598_KNICA
MHKTFGQTVARQPQGNHNRGSQMSVAEIRSALESRGEASGFNSALMEATITTWPFVLLSERGLGDIVRFSSAEDAKLAKQLNRLS